MPLAVGSVTYTDRSTSRSRQSASLPLLDRLLAISMAVIRKLCVLVSRARCRFLGALLVFWVIITLIYSKWSISGSNPAKRATLIPNKIWQLWVHPTEQPSQDWRESSHTWIDLNPSWDYKIEIMTDSYAQAYVQKVFKDRQDIVDAFARANKTIQRADLLRYLWLLEKGGVYSDLDARCTKPLRDWIPPRYRSSTGLVIGIEVDDYFEDRYDPDVPYIQLCQWTIMARPYHPTMTKVVDTVVRRLQDWEAGDVEELTGPKVSH